MKKFHIEHLKEISSSKEKIKKKQLFYLNKKSNNSKVSKSLDLYKSNNNSKYLSNNPSTQSKKNYNYYIDRKDIFDIKDTNEGNNKFNFLRKKTKITFITKKQKKKKRKIVFITTKYFKKNDNIFFGKSNKNDVKNIYLKNKLFQTYKCLYRDDSIKNTNRGRWSYEEHIKFIESFVNYGNNWEIIQKHIGTRSCKQIISHAQKFFLRIKELNTNKSSFNFQNNNIKNLSDVIDLISRTNKTIKDNKKYLIDTLITLTELNLENKGRKFFERKKDNLIVEIKKEKAVNDKLSKTYDESLNKIDINNINLELDDLISGTNLIKDEDDDIIENKKFNLGEININNNILFELKEKNIYNNDKIIHGQNYNSNYKHIDNSINQYFFGNNNSFFLSDCSCFSNVDGTFIKPINNIIKKISNQHF